MNANRFRIFASSSPPTVKWRLPHWRLALLTDDW
jgi:hypothetical protein